MPPPPVICQTPRLLLRPFQEDDVEALAGYLGDPQVMRHSIHGVHTRQDIRTRFLPACLARYARDGLGQWAVIRRGDGALIGGCGICAQQVEGQREYEISYRLRREAWHQGLATEAARACRDYGFDKAGLERLVSIIEAANTTSIRVAEKIGMTLDRPASFQGIPVLVYAIQPA